MFSTIDSWTSEWGGYFGFFVLIITAFVWYFKYNSRSPPGPWSLPIFGYLPFIDRKHPHKTFHKLARKYGPIYHVKLGSLSTVVISDPAIIKEAFNRSVFNDRAKLYLTHGIMEGYGLVAAEGELWKNQRKFVLNTLKNLGMIKLGDKRSAMEERILIGVRKAISDISDYNGKPLNLQEILLNSLGNVINSFVLGKTWRNKDPQWVYLKSLIEDGVKMIGVAGPINFFPLLRWIPKYRKIYEYIMDGKKKTHKIYDKIYELKSVSENGVDDVISAYKKEMMNGCGNAYFTKDQMYHIVADLCGAGTDTTLNTLRWLMVYLAVHQDIQKKLQEELDIVLHGRDEPHLEDLQYLPYTEACLKEAQRIRSVTPLGIPHSASSDTELEGYLIAKDTMILPLQWGIHMNPDIWQDPNKFIPERFLDDNNKVSNKLSHFIPFQTGKRICIGEELAKMFLFLFGAGILKVYKVSLGEEYSQEQVATILDGISGIVLEPGHHTLKFEYRNELNSGPANVKHEVYY